MLPTRPAVTSTFSVAISIARGRRADERRRAGDALRAFAARRTHAEVPMPCRHPLRRSRASSERQDRPGARPGDLGRRAPRTCEAYSQPTTPPPRTASDAGSRSISRICRSRGHRGRSNGMPGRAERARAGRHQDLVGDEVREPPRRPSTSTVVRIEQSRGRRGRAPRDDASRLASIRSGLELAARRSCAAMSLATSSSRSTSTETPYRSRCRYPDRNNAASRRVLRRERAGVHGGAARLGHGAPPPRRACRSRRPARRPSHRRRRRRSRRGRSARRSCRGSGSGHAQDVVARRRDPTRA